MPESRYRVLALASHPVQYMSPVLRRMAERPELDLTVAYCSLQGAEAVYDPEFAATVQWDIPLLEGYPWVRLANRGPERNSFWGRCNPGVWRIIRSGGFDAVLCFTGYRSATFWMALVAARLSGTAFLFGTDATTIHPRDGKRWKTWPKKLLWPSLFRQADQVIVPSSGSSDLMRSLGVPEDRVTLTPYSVDNEWWTSQAAKVDRNAVRARWGIPPASHVVLFCAKLQPWKRPLDPLLAFAKGMPNNYLVYAGEGPLREKIAAEAQRLGVQDRVRLLGFVNQSELPAVYRSSDVMVLSSEYEPFAVVVNEAMCCGCAVIASDRVGASRDLVAPVAEQLVYPCGDLAALERALAFVLSDGERLARLSAGASERIRTWSAKENIDAVIAAVATAVERLGRKGKRASGSERGLSQGGSA